MRERPLAEVPDYIADRIGQQQPIAGMHGGVLRRTVSQFRMPGYPYVLVTTDVLQEGEDHQRRDLDGYLFCPLAQANR